MSVTAKSSAEHDYLARYLHQVWQAPLLSREEEVALAQEMKLGGRAGQRARDKLVTAHQKLAAKVARKFATNHRREMEDLLQEANIGLLVAVDKFEVERGFRFSTMAFHWVRQQVSDYCANNTPQVRIPVTRMRKIRKLRETILKLEAAGQAVTDTALAAEMQCSVAEVRDLSDDLLHQVSLNAPIGDSGTEFGAFIPDESSPDAEDVLISEQQREILREEVANLPERDRTVLTMRFGLDGEEERTLDEVSQVFGVTRERIRQIQVKALAKLKKRTRLS